MLWRGSQLPLSFNLKRIHYNKLVRDNIPKIIGAKGVQYKIKILTKKEFERALLKKVGEEASALPKTRSTSELIGELADILDIVEELKKLKGISHFQLTAAQKKNRLRKGGFKKKLFLFWSSDDGYKTNEKTNK
jgi:predicted house-cleaning noncanonical NTP pyrophosphatase (MazG superfamily)